MLLAVRRLPGRPCVALGSPGRGTLAARSFLLRESRRQLCGGARPPDPGKAPKGFGGFMRQRPAGGGGSGSGGAGARGAGESSQGSAAGESSQGRAAGEQAKGAGSKEGGGATSGSGGGPSADPGGSKPPGGGNQQQQMLHGLGLLSCALIAYQTLPSGNAANEITQSDFRRELLETGHVSRIVVINKSRARVFMSNGTTYEIVLGTVGSFEKKLEQAQVELGVAPRDFIPVTYENETSWLGELSKIGPTLLLIGFWVFMLRQGGMGGGGGGGRNIFSVGKSKPTIITKEQNTGVAFKDVAGLAEAKVEVMELVDFLKRPERYRELGAKIPKGALLVGPPGTGKTLLAKATAGEANVPFLSVSGSDFIEMFVGVGPARVRDLFAQAKAMQPCIIFIDEIDAVGKARGRGGVMGGNDERENTLNQLLVEMDGFSSSGQIVIMAGTNRPDSLDSALLRPGRFDRMINVDPPDIKGRAEIFRVHLPRITLAEPVDEVAKRLAALSPGFSGADIANVVNEAALIAARHKKETVGFDEFDKALDRVIGGLEKKTKVLSVAEKTRVAHHEAGHAVTSWFLEHASPLLKVSIVPRGVAALGYAQYVPKERKLHTKDQMMDTMCMMMGGKAAEALFFKRISTGAQDDLKKVTQLAYALVSTYGMSAKIGHLSYRPPQDGQLASQRPYSELTAEIVDEEARKIANHAYDRTLKLLEEKKELVKALAELLLEKEVIHKADVVAVLGERQWKDSDTYDEIIDGMTAPPPTADGPVRAEPVDGGPVPPAEPAAAATSEVPPEVPPTPR